MMTAKSSTASIFFIALAYFLLPIHESYAQLPAITVAKSFNPTTIGPYQTSTLTITLGNTGPNAATLTTAFTDKMPEDVIIVGAATPSAGCTGTAVTNTTNLITLPVGAIIAATGVCTITATVTSSNVGVYLNRTSDLVTKVGDASPTTAPGAQATLVVNSPRLEKSFEPCEVSTGEESTLTITLTNPLPVAAVLSEPLVDSLDEEIDICDDAINTCGGSVDIDDSTITLSGATIPAMSSCFVQVQVKSDCPGHYENCLPEGALQTDQGSNQEPATATLIVCGEDDKK